ncbi:hypothetical protein FNF27_02945 [Cafeteria roenbergensis]|uniref:RING-type E3 ubiquitin transferase n=1 Tax=Cafeteria roenbergensis TaxID=33653 RepID=A0A5A8ECI1_CAFRO|nr:hypothetical protein FNF27_02945 [Cafeteria roenbergensis]|mmetsp:Transcript_9145/g.35770  ORF Transcript_9145/g.35770 Transcript_9145/m.35770 type:complete len:547 (-) Transcript_9145:230-1870(-)
MASEATTPEAQGCSDDPALECEVFENQRWKPLVGWTSSMLITDRWSFSDADGRSLDRQQVGLPRGYVWSGPWQLDVTWATKAASGSASEGGRTPMSSPPPGAWKYALNFPARTSMYEGAAVAGLTHFVRWRRWVRSAARTPEPCDAEPGLADSGPRFSSADSIHAAFGHFASGEAGDSVPVYACCPVSFELFNDPVVSASGRTYEREILEWVISHDGHDPITRSDIRGRAVVPDHAMAGIVRAWKHYVSTGDGSALLLPGITDPAELLRSPSHKEVEDAVGGRLDGFWQCRVCTFVNSGLEGECTVCQTPKGDTPLIGLREATAIITGKDHEEGGSAAAASSGADAAASGASAAKQPARPAAAGAAPAAAAAAAAAADAKAQAGGPPPDGSVHEAHPAVVGRRAGGGAPDWLCCPLTGRVFRDPVILPSGYSFEREALFVRWSCSAATMPDGIAGRDPVTGAPVREESVYPHFALKDACDDWRVRSSQWIKRPWSQARGCDSQGETELREAMLREEGGPSEPERTRAASRASQTKRRVDEDGWEVL